MSLYIQEAANLFVGDDGPDHSKHHQLESINLPTLEEVSETHHAGGAVGELSISGLGLKALEVTFKLKGWDPQVYASFGVASRQRLPFTSYGLVRDKRTNRAIEVKAVIEGRLSKLAPDSFERGKLFGHDHSLAEVTHYALTYDQTELYYYDWATGIIRIRGTAVNADELSILRIPV